MSDDEKKTSWTMREVLGQRTSDEVQRLARAVVTTLADEQGGTVRGDISLLGLALAAGNLLSLMRYKAKGDPKREEGWKLTRDGVLSTISLIADEAEIAPEAQRLLDEEMKRNVH